MPIFQVEDSHFMGRVILVLFVFFEVHFSLSSTIDILVPELASKSPSSVHIFFNFWPRRLVITVIVFTHSTSIVILSSSVYSNLSIIKVKQSRYRPGVAQRVPGS
jgi:hypothetical protein